MRKHQTVTNSIKSWHVRFGAKSEEGFLLTTISKNCLLTSHLAQPHMTVETGSEGSREFQSSGWYGRMAKAAIGTEAMRSKDLNWRRKNSSDAWVDSSVWLDSSEESCWQQNPLACKMLLMQIPHESIDHVDKLCLLTSHLVQLSHRW